ncbi:MAG TPA: TIGR01777 family oxidoreductase [Vicinamibacterales bacterium]|jgi:uncharacterized protein (TIGR01777 family)|nr:TIGR01777 family oxidoreductase [Vicinamibacterales bacterium]
MKVVVAGGTGFLGSALAASLRLDGHHVLVMTRHPNAHDEVPWTDASVFDGADAVVNLAGEPLDAGRWNAARKASILESRVKNTEALVKGMSSVARRPAVFLNGSAVGFYGAHANEALTEESPPGSDYLASVCIEWEKAAMAAAWMTRVVLLRTGLPLDKNGGALPKLALPFRLFAGGRAGSGDQYWSWIHRDDWARMVRWAIDNPEIKGPVNLTAPSPVTNREFAAALGRALHRPALAAAPGFALRLAFGEMADALILSGQRVLPTKAERNGFEFRYPDLQSALRQIYQ